MSETHDCCDAMTRAARGDDGKLGLVRVVALVTDGQTARMEGGHLAIRVRLRERRQPATVAMINFCPWCGERVSKATEGGTA